jgi:hypothetical protein
MARTKKTCPIPLCGSLWGNLKNGKNKEECSIPLFDSLWRNLKNGKNKEECPIPLFDSLWRNLKKAKTKEDISYASLSFSLEEQRRHALSDSHPAFFLLIATTSNKNF